MSESEQIISAEELLRRIERAPFSGPMLDVPPTRRVIVRGLSERQLPKVMTLLERAFGAYEDVQVRPDDDLNFNLDIAPLFPADNWRSAQRLHEIIGFLRSPEGCPWDRAQDWSTLAPKLAEEAYEVIDAIAEGSAPELAGELGDLLLVVALIVQIAEERGDFTIEDVYELVNRKLIRRHPHVFGDDAADTPEAVLSTWQRVKREERGDAAAPRSKYERMPKSMPALTKAAMMFEDVERSSAMEHLPAEGDALLALIDAMLSKGRDPEAELQEALDRKYKTK